MNQSLTQHPLFSYAFRPFFLALALVAISSIAVWVAALSGVLPYSLGHYGPLWHGHEMLFGFALAAVAGFVLTAVATWTGRPPVQGSPLLILLLTWLLARVTMAFAHLLAPTWVLLLSLCFPLMLVFLAGREVVLSGNRRNYPVVLIILLLALFNLAYHLDAAGYLPGAQRQSLIGAVYGFALLVTVIGGRIIPSFTSNWLRARGIEQLPKSSLSLDALTIGFTLATGVLAVFAADAAITAIAAACASVLHVARLVRWRGLATFAEPLLLVLHVAYAWLPISFALLAASVVFSGVPSSSALHGLAVGAIGSMILAVITRVSLGHTGRPLRAAPLTVAAYFAVNIAVLLRVAAPVAGAGYLAVINTAAVVWIIAWLLFLVVYSKILLTPR